MEDQIIQLLTNTRSHSLPDHLHSTVHLLALTFHQMLSSKRRHQRRIHDLQVTHRIGKLFNDHQRRVADFRRHQSHARAEFLFVLLGACTAKPSPQRAIWSHPRDKQFWEFIVQRTFTASDWLENFRMSRETFDYLCSKLEPVIRKQNTLFRKCIPVEQRLAATIWSLATGAEYRTLSSLFGVSKAALCTIIKEVCKGIIDVFWEDNVHVPRNSNDLNENMLIFKKKWGIPHCIGALGSIHVSIKTPHGCDDRYCNNGGWYSFLLQALVDHRGLFMDATADSPGRTTSAEALIGSKLYEKSQNGSLFLKLDTLPIEVPSVLVVGDSSYPPLPWLLVPFPDSDSLTDEERKFNSCIGRAHRVFEEAVTRLRGRWQCLRKRSTIRTQDVPSIVSVCCVLHNICEVRGDVLDPSWIQPGGEFNRDAIVDYPQSVVDDEVNAIRVAVAKDLSKTD